MAPRGERFNGQSVDMKRCSFFKGFRRRDRFKFRSEDGGMGGFYKGVEIRDMIIVRMREKNRIQLKIFGRDRIEHGADRSSGIKRYSAFGSRVPNEIAVHRHVFEVGVEYGETSRKQRLLGVPRLASQVDERIGAH